MLSWALSPRHQAVQPHFATAIPGETPHRAYGRYLVTCSSNASLAWLVWDIFITFEEEVEVVWPMGWSFIKCVYYFIRYMGVCLQASTTVVGTPDSGRWNYSTKACFIWQAYQAIAALLITLAVEYILLIRVFALYSHNRIIKFALPALFLAEVIIMLVSLVSFLPNITFDITCSATSSPKGMFTFGAAPIAFQLVLFILTLVKFLSALRAGWGTTPIMALLVRDGTWSFFVIIIFLICYGLHISFSDGSMTSLLYNWLISLYSFVGYRNLLNIFQFSQARSTAAWSETLSTSAPPFQLSTNIFITQHTNYEEEPQYELGVMTRAGS